MSLLWAAHELPPTSSSSRKKDEQEGGKGEAKAGPS